MRLLVPLETKLLETGLQTVNTSEWFAEPFWVSYMSPIDSAEGEIF